MILLAHIIIALTSVLFTAYVYVAPSQTKLRIGYGLAIGTLSSGSVLLVMNPSHLVSACLMGLLYFGIVLSGMLAAKQKMAFTS